MSKVQSGNAEEPAIRLSPLPTQWCWTNLESVVDAARPICYGILMPKANLPEGVLYVKVKDMKGDRIDLPSLHRTSSAIANQYKRSSLKAGDLLLSIRGTFGRVAHVPQELDGANITQDTARLAVVEGLHPSYVAHWLRSPSCQGYFKKVARGVAVRGVNIADVKRCPVPLASLKHQENIVSKIEELLSDLDAGVAALERIRASLKRYRAAVLKAAVDGRLTEEWRARHPRTESASKLLERILADRRKKWEQDQLVRFAAAGKTPPEKWRERYVEPRGPNTVGLPGLPRTWCWAKVEQVGEVQLGRQRSPKHHEGLHMRPYLRVANVFEDRIDIDDVMEMNFTPYEYETYRLCNGDILLNEGQSIELVGRPAIYRDEVPGACFTNTLVRFRAGPGVDPCYALKVFLAYLKNGRFQAIATFTVNIAHLGAGRFSEIEFPLPPIEEQAAILQEVERHFSVIDAAEKAIAINLRRAARLRRSILQRAFEGKLVPQDPTDEPAVKLLERIRAARNGSPAPRARRRRAATQQSEGDTHGQ